MYDTKTEQQTSGADRPWSCIDYTQFFCSYNWIYRLMHPLLFLNYLNTLLSELEVVSNNKFKIIFPNLAFDNITLQKVLTLRIVATDVHNLRIRHIEWHLPLIMPITQKTKILL